MTAPSDQTRMTRCRHIADALRSTWRPTVRIHSYQERGISAVVQAAAKLRAQLAKDDKALSILMDTTMVRLCDSISKAGCDNKEAEKACRTAKRVVHPDRHKCSRTAHECFVHLEAVRYLFDCAAQPSMQRVTPVFKRRPRYYLSEALAQLNRQAKRKADMMDAKQDAKTVRSAPRRRQPQTQPESTTAASCEAPPTIAGDEAPPATTREPTTTRPDPHRPEPTVARDEAPPPATTRRPPTRPTTAREGGLAKSACSYQACVLRKMGNRAWAVLAEAQRVAVGMGAAVSDPRGYSLDVIDKAVSIAYSNTNNSGCIWHMLDKACFDTDAGLSVEHVENIRQAYHPLPVHLFIEGIVDNKMWHADMEVASDDDEQWRRCVGIDLAKNNWYEAHHTQTKGWTMPVHPAVHRCKRYSRTPIMFGVARPNSTYRMGMRADGAKRRLPADHSGRFFRRILHVRVFVPSCR